VVLFHSFGQSQQERRRDKKAGCETHKVGHCLFGAFALPVNGEYPESVYKGRKKGKKRDPLKSSGDGVSPSAKV